MGHTRFRMKFYGSLRLNQNKAMDKIRRERAKTFFPQNKISKSHFNCNLCNFALPQLVATKTITSLTQLGIHNYFVVTFNEIFLTVEVIVIVLKQNNLLADSLGTRAVRSSEWISQNNNMRLWFDTVTVFRAASTKFTYVHLYYIVNWCSL